MAWSDGIRSRSMHGVEAASEGRATRGTPSRVPDCCEQNSWRRVGGMRSPRSRLCVLPTFVGIQAGRSTQRPWNWQGIRPAGTNCSEHSASSDWSPHIRTS